MVSSLSSNLASPPSVLRPKAMRFKFFPSRFILLVQILFSLNNNDQHRVFVAAYDAILRPYGNYYCEEDPNIDVIEFDAFLRLNFNETVDLDAYTVDWDAIIDEDRYYGSLRSQIEQVVDHSYTEFVARSCDLAQFRSFVSKEKYPPTIIEPPLLASPTSSPSRTHFPTLAPTKSRSKNPSPEPSSQPGLAPFSRPSLPSQPALFPTLKPTLFPPLSWQPTVTPTSKPYLMLQPTVTPTSKPALSPLPLSQPTMTPTSKPYLLLQPTLSPTSKPTLFPPLSWQPIVRLGGRRHRLAKETISSSSLTDSVLIQLKLKARVPKNHTRVALDAFEPPGTLATPVNDTIEFLEQRASSFCSTDSLKFSYIFMSDLYCATRNPFDWEWTCQCPKDGCYCANNSAVGEGGSPYGIVALTQDEFLKVLNEYLPLSSFARKLLLNDENMGNEVAVVGEQQRRNLNSITAVNEVVELQEFLVCEASTTVSTKVVHLIDQDPLKVQQDVLDGFLDELTNIIDSTTLGNCDSSFRQIDYATLDVDEVPVSRRRLNGARENENFYSYSITYQVLSAEKGESGNDLFSPHSTNSQRRLSGPSGGHVEILTNADTGSRRCFCEKFVDFERRGISYEEYKAAVDALIKKKNVIPGATTLHAVVEFEQRTCLGNGEKVTGRGLVLVELNVPASTLTQLDKNELERACVRAYNQQNTLSSCDLQQYRVTACSLSPLYPGSNSSLDILLRFNFSCVGCGSGETAFTTRNNRKRRRNLMERDIIKRMNGQQNLDQNSTCWCPKNSTEEPSRPAVQDLAENMNTTGQIGDPANAIEVTQEDCGEGVVLFVNVSLNIQGNLATLDDSERNSFESLFQQTINRLSIELCDPNFVHAFESKLGEDENGNPIMNIGYVCYGLGCTADGSPGSLLTASSTTRLLWAAPSSRIQTTLGSSSDPYKVLKGLPPTGPLARKRLLQAAVVPISQCLCDRRAEGNTQITTEAFDKRLNEKISRNPETFRSISGIQTTVSNLQTSSASWLLPWQTIWMSFVFIVGTVLVSSF